MPPNNDPNAIGYETLPADLNKMKGAAAADNKDGVVGPKLSELTLDTKNEDLIKTLNQWEKDWEKSEVKPEWEKKCEEAIKYWKGKQYDAPKGKKDRPNVDNILFESLETYLPQVTRRNPDVMVEVDDEADAKDQKNQEFATNLKLKLGKIADKNKLRLKLKGAARKWALEYLGPLKVGWSLDENMPVVRVIKPRKLILDPLAWTDEDGYSGTRVGEHRRLPADKLLAIIGDNKDDADNVAARKAITEAAGAETLATELQFVEWWTNEYTCWKLKDTILLKKKNPYWNYDKTPEVPADLNTPEATANPHVSTDNYGNNTASPTVAEPGVNHFETPRIPYLFLSVYNLGDQPMDNTSLVEQNLANQDRINKRNRQIDKNADNMNEGLVVSLARAGLTASEAKNVTVALRKGGVVAIPDGDPREAVYRPETPGLPADIYNDRNDLRDRVRDIFGTRGSSAAGLQTEKTVRGKIVYRGLDTDRIGGGISEFLEQLADAVYNYWTQVLFSMDPDFQFTQANKPPKVNISVKEGSLLPKDSTTIANQAMELASEGKMSTLDLYKRLEYPNAEELAVNAWLEKNAPDILYSFDARVKQAMDAQRAAAAKGGSKPPSESINFKDLPPEGKVQMAGQAGIQLDAGGVAADEAADKQPPPEKPVVPSILSEVKPDNTGVPNQ